jgi:large subunit ribosomal protein L32
MALPKFKISRAKSRTRRSANMKIELPQLSLCPKCGERKMPHRVCPKCGYYKNREVVKYGND